MNYPKLPQLQLGNLEPPLPIIQGGMGVGISLSGLASAVANEGGIGVISATGIGMMEPDFNADTKAANGRALRREIRTAREKSRGIIGVNILVALTDYLDLFEIAVDEGIDVLFLGAGLPLQVPESLVKKGLKDLPTRIVPIVSSLYSNAQTSLPSTPRCVPIRINSGAMRITGNQCHRFCLPKATVRANGKPMDAPNQRGNMTADR